MDDLIKIDLTALAFAFIPVALVLMIIAVWRGKAFSAGYAVSRMVAQLVLVGYVLAALFTAETPWTVMAALGVMLLAAAWISLRTVAEQRRPLLIPALVSISFSALLVLALITQLVLQIEPWWAPRYLLPLGGMVFSAAMNAVSLAAERVEADLAGGSAPAEARGAAFQAALIPVVNSLFAVGLVSLPGMMTGQILSGVSPLIAARYQMVVMCMLFSVSGLAAAAFLLLHKRITVSGASDGKAAN